MVNLKTLSSYSVEWAKLDRDCDMKIKDYIAKVKAKDPIIQNNYLFDWSLPLHCPELDAHFEIPKYFKHDLLKKTSEGSDHETSIDL